MTRALEAGQALFEEGQPCRGLLIVAEGRVEIRQISPRGREQIFHTEGPGATLGEGPLFDGGGYIAAAVAVAPTLVLVLSRAEVVRLCHRHPAVALAMLRTMARRVRHFAGIVSDLAFRPVTERLARFLDAVAIERGAPVELALTQAQLATGVISRARSRVTIRDPVRLDALASGDEAAASGDGRVT